jgi:TatD DNase family protein
VTLRRGLKRLNLPEGWFIAVGVHPKHALDFGDYYFDRLSKLLDFPAVTALGEVGIDCSEGAKPFGIQSSTLKWVLALARPYMPLVFHIRASGDNREVLDLTLDKVPNTLQSIHLHCFNGDEATVKLWLDAYPGTYFGFSCMVKGFGDRQRGGLKAVPGNRLLLESDSLHLPDVAGSINHPAHLFRVAEEVARVRGQSPLDILRAGIADGQALYRRK